MILARWVVMLQKTKRDAHGAAPGPARTSPVERRVNDEQRCAVKQQHITELTPVASRFLSCLEAELCASAEFQARSDCGATSAIHYPAVGNTAAPAFMGAAQPMPR